MAIASNAAAGARDLRADRGDRDIFLRDSSGVYEDKDVKERLSFVIGSAGPTLKEFGNKIGRPVSDPKEGEGRTAV
jgi:hypothetical protein